ncbi:MAG: AAA family ATPase [Proteobacteria bacterium]|nr:AAA family ATPase [Pseudomonadota bacterium]
MYNEHFRISENPFSLTPDPRFLFMSQRHQEALAHLLYGMQERGGFVQLTGEVGTGKTTLCRSLLEQVPERVNVALILNPKQTATELVASICDELHVPYPDGTESLKVLIDLLNRHLLETHANGFRTILIIDEAQNLSIDALEQVRLLTNLETSTQKLLQIILIGQPELETLLARPELRQLGQRITARYHLTPLSSMEIKAYIMHRLEVVGCKQQLFTRSALRLIYSLSAGFPRLINIICDRAMLGAYAEQAKLINWRLVRKAAHEVMGRTKWRIGRRTIAWATAVLVLVLLGSAWQFVQVPSLEEQPIVASLARPGPGLKQDLEQKSFGDAPVRLADILNNGAIKTDTGTAFGSLFRHWQLSYSDLKGKTACDRAIAGGLRCFLGKGNWTTLMLFNRPAVLELIDEVRYRHNVLVVGLENDKVILDFSGREITVLRSMIEPFWLGDFILLWKPPPISSYILQKGDRGPDVLWLRAQLDRVEGVKSTNPSPRFDEMLKKRLIKFQQARAIKADGMVGEQTFIQLNLALGDQSGPRLKAAAKEKG